jgi:hypothetical protein
MNITPKKFSELLKKYPKSEVKVNKVLCFEGRMDMLLVHFRGKGYEISFPTNTLIKSGGEKYN